jgi:peptidoglycan-associated lipoprotein
MKKFIVLLLLTSFSLSLTAQPLRKITYKMMIETAEVSMETGDYLNALDYYKMAYEDKKEKEISLKIAQVYYLLKDYKYAANYYKRILRRDKKNEYFEHKLFYGKSLKRLNEYQDAYTELVEYARATEDPDGRAEAMLEIRGMEMYNELADNVEMEFTPLDDNINKAFSIYGASVHPDGSLYFGSFDSRKKIVLNGEAENENAKIYVAKPDASGMFSELTPLGEHINRPEFSSVHPSFSADGQRMYFTRVLLQNNEIKDAKLFVSQLKETEWSPPMELMNVNGADFNSLHPAVGELFGQEVLYFISDMAGGKGGYDIYYATIGSDGSYSNPVNLGSAINTVDDELSPYFVDGKLYYSTNGLSGLGGFDIYFSVWDGQKWAKPENMGKGYNSSVDDLFFSIDEDGRKGFLLSSRPYKGKRKLQSETCCDHLFKISARQLIINLLAEVYNEEGPLTDAKIELLDMSKVNPADPVTRSNFNGNSFNFLLTQDIAYKAIVTHKGYDPKTIEFTTAGILDDYTVKKQVTLEKMAPEVQIVKINEPIRLNNIYYDYDDFKILPDAEQDLETLMGLMIKYDDMVIELSSHTDARGKTDYNQRLSQKRANAAKSWLVENGIEDDRIKPVGYGESQILNRCKNGVNCSDDDHRFNRRTEFKIIAGPTTIEIEKQVNSEE